MSEIFGGPTIGELTTLGWIAFGLFVSVSLAMIGLALAGIFAPTKT